MGFGGTLVQTPSPKVLGPRSWSTDFIHGRLGETGTVWRCHPGETPEETDARLRSYGYVLCDDLMSFHTALAKWYEEHPPNMPAKAPTLPQEPRQGLERPTTAQNGIDATTRLPEPKESEQT